MRPRRGARAGLAALALAACSGSGSAPAGPRLVVHLVLPDSPDPSDDSLTTLQISVVWDGGDAGLSEGLQDGGLEIPLPAGPVDVTVTGVNETGAARWRGVARAVDVPADGAAGPAVATMLFGRIGSFSSFNGVAAMPPLAGSAAASWGDGRVVISGGQLADGGLTANVWVYDPRTVQVSLLGHGSLVPRAHHLALPLLDLSGDPMVLLAGGDAAGGGPTDAVELLLPDGGALLAPLSAPEREPSGAVTDTGRVVLGCGSPGSSAIGLYDPTGALTFQNGGSSGSLSLPASCELGQITWLPSLGACIAGDGADRALYALVNLVESGVTPWASTPAVRTHFGAVAGGGGLFQFGGFADGGPTSTYEDDSDAGPPVPAGTMSQPRADFGWLQIPDGGLLIVGGADSAGGALATAETVDFQNPTASTAGFSMAQARIHPAVVDISGYGEALVVSGELANGGPVGGLEIYTY